jgi:hypothetical protein
VSAANISPTPVLAAITRGYASQGEMEDYFGVDCGSPALRSTLGLLERHKHVERNRQTGEVKAL